MERQLPQFCVGHQFRSSPAPLLPLSEAGGEELFRPGPQLLDACFLQGVLDEFASRPGGGHRQNLRRRLFRRRKQDEPMPSPTVKGFSSMGNCAQNISILHSYFLSTKIGMAAPGFRSAESAPIIAFIRSKIGICETGIESPRPSLPVPTDGVERIRTA